MTRFKFRRLFAVVLALSMLLGSVALPTAAFYDNRAVETVDAAAVYATDADGGGTLELDYVGIADVYEIEEAIIALAGSTISLAGRGDARFSADGDPRPGGAAAFQQYPACATVGQFAGGSWIRYEDIDLSDGLGSFRIRYLGGGSGSFDVRIGDPGNRLEGAAAIDATTLVGSVSRGAGGGLPWSGVGAGRWTALTEATPVIGGVRDVYIVLNTTDTNFGELELTLSATETVFLPGRGAGGADFGQGSDNRDWPFGGGDYIGGFGAYSWVRWNDVDLQAGIVDFFVTYFGLGGYPGFFDLRVGDPENRAAGFEGAREIAAAVRNGAGTGGWSGSVDSAVVDVPAAGTWGGIADVYLRFRTSNTNFRNLTLTVLDGTWDTPQPPPPPPANEITLSGLGGAAFRATPPHDGMYVGGGGVVGSISGDGSWIRFDDINLLAGIRAFEVIYAGSGDNMRYFDIVVAPAESRVNTGLLPVGDAGFTLIGTAGSNQNTGGWNENFPSDPVRHAVSGQPVAGGLMDVYLVFRGGNANFVNLFLELISGTWVPPVLVGDPLPYTESILRPANVDAYIAEAFLLLRHDRPARPNFANNNQTFNDTTHIGNGRMGANLFGGVVSNVISINEHTVWAGGPGANPNYNNMMPNPNPAGTTMNSYRHNFRGTPLSAQTALQRIREQLDAEVAAYAANIQFCDPQNGIPCYPASFPMSARSDVSNCPGGIHVVSEYPVALQSQDGPWPGGGTPGNRHNPNRGQVVRDIEYYLSGGRANFGSYMELGRINLLDPEMPRPVLPPPPAQNITTNQPGGGGEVPQNIFLDNDSKWFTGSMPSAANPHWVEWTFGQPYTFNAFTIATANDMPGRDPAVWRLLGSDNRTDWSVIHNQQTLAMPTARNTGVVFETPEVTFTYFRFEVSSVRDSGGFQISRLLLGQGTPPTAPPENTAFVLGSYDRTLLLETGIARTEFTRTNGDNAGINFTREYFMNHPQNVMGMRMTGSERFDQLIRIVTPQPAVQIYVPYLNILRMVGQPADHLPLADAALHFVMEVMVVPIRDGAVANDAITVVGNMLDVRDVDEIILLTVAGTNYYQDITHNFNFFIHRDEAFAAVRARLLAAAAMGYNQLLANHVEDHMNLFGRVDFSLEGLPQEAPAEPAEQIVWGYNQVVDAPRPGGTGGSPGRRTGDRGAWPGPGENPFTDPINPNQGLTVERRAELDRYLEVLMFQFGRYLLIGSSREGGLPANLQGIWAVGLNPPWEADYHTNVNVQMNYWPAEVTNLMETHLPMLAYVRAQVPRGEIVAQHYHMRPVQRGGVIGEGSRGWVAYHVNNIWGHTVPESFWEAFYAPSGGAWMALVIWENYLFNRDATRLLEFWDTLYGAAIFWEDNLWIDSTDGRLVTNPSYSPEHGPYSLGATSDQALVYEIFNAALGAAAALEAAGLGANITAEQRAGLAQIENSLENLGGPRIGRSGYFQEWRQESQMDRLGLQNPFPNSGPHRHVNHLFAIHPGTWVVPERSAEDDAFTEAIRVALGGGRTDGTTGWSRGWTLNIRARLLEDAAAFRTYQGLLLNQKLPNLFGTHEPFQIDGNFGATAGVAEMLIQSHADVIRLLPAIPRDGPWASGHVTGLRARGNITVDQFWSEGSLDTAVLHVGTAGDIVVHYPLISTRVLVNSNGAVVPFETINENRISFEATAGGVYTFEEPTVPGAPQGVMAIGGNGQIVVTWEAPVTDGGAPITSYEVSIDGVTWITVPAGMTHTFTGLTNGVEYTVRVRAVNSVGAGMATTVTARPIEPLPQPTIPGAPQNVIATAGNGQITISWQPAASDGGAPVGHYEVSIDGVTWLAVLGRVHTFTGLTNGTTYTVSVRGINLVGAGAAATATATPVAPPPDATVPSVPLNVTAVAGNGQITVSWQAPESDGGEPVTHYQVSIDGVTWITVPAGMTHTFTGLTNGTAYTVRVRAVNSVGTGAAATATATPVAPPPPPPPPPPGDVWVPPTPPPPQAPPVVEIDDEEVPLAEIPGFGPFIEGFPDDTFRGANRITREEFVTILFRIHNPEEQPEADAETPSFTDVPPSRWSFDAIEWALAAEIIDEGMTFRPRAELTRAEMAVMLVRAEGWTEVAEDAFSDIEGHVSSDYILKAVYEGIFEGFPDGTFRPDATATRFEMVTALTRYVTLQTLGEPVTDDMIEGLDFSLTDVPRTHWAFRYVVLATAGYEAQLPE